MEPFWVPFWDENGTENGNKNETEKSGDDSERERPPSAGNRCWEVLFLKMQVLGVVGVNSDIHITTRGLYI